MHLDDDCLRLSPSDLSAFLGCRHRTGLDLAVAHGAIARPDQSDPRAQALRDRGAAHELAYVEKLRADGLTLTEIASEGTPDERAAATVAAVRSGVDVVVQAALVSDGWAGYADILRRVESPSALGTWSYEPLDTKLARETRAGTILQLAAYVDLLAELQGVRPARFHVVTPSAPGVTGGEHIHAAPGFAIHTYRIADFAAYFRLVRGHLADEVARGHDAILSLRYPDPVETCEVCRWWARCHGRRRADDHLSFIAGAGRLHRHELIAQGYSTLAQAAAMPLPIAFKPARGSRGAYARIREQARMQLQQRTTGQPSYELLPAADGCGLARLPEPSAGDLFLDLEGARFAREGGREFLFGLAQRDGRPAVQSYSATWAFTDGEERTAFDALIERILQAWDADPNMHVYHFGHYEPAALKRLMGRHALRGDALDRLLRAERFVDLHAIVRQSLRAGVESYSLKQLEPIYGFVRDVSLRDARADLLSVELALEANAPWTIDAAVRSAVEGYNRDDCRSAEALRGWLERVRTTAIAAGTSMARPVAQDGAPNDRVRELEGRQEATRAELLGSIAPDAIDSTHPQHPTWLLAHLIDWHRREDKTHYWERFRLAALSDEELLEERQAIAGLQFVERLEESRFKNGNLKSVVDRYRYPVQETELGRKGELRMPGNAVAGGIADHDRVARTIDIRKGRETHETHPPAVFQAIAISTDVQQEALLRFAAGFDEVSCGTDLLFRRTPRLRAGEFHPRPDETAVQFAIRVATELDRTTLAIQGPPGAGKTYVGARMIRALVRAGRKVGVTAASHKVIRNLLDAVAQQDRDEGAQAVHVDVTADGQYRLDWDAPDRLRALVLGHKCDPDEDDDDGDHSPVRELADNTSALAALASGAIDVLGATPWLWARAEAAGAVDVLFVDEAGQMSLANALAVSGAAGSLVLLGDPQQLEQPQKGSHPDGVGVSALEHVLGDAATMPAGRGLFLPTTWRLHPAICAFTSELFYAGKLQSKAGLERQRLSGTAEFDGAGLWWVPVAHDGNQNASLEEVEIVVRLVKRLLAPGAMWIDEHGVSRQITGSDLRVVAPFNAQVNRLSERLAGLGVPVGTVDRFQGQEAPVVIYSMAASRAEDAPHGMEFLFSLNRVNVATSRARCAAMIVSSPALGEAECRTPRQMMLANAMCRFVEMATRLSVCVERNGPDVQHLVGEQDAEEYAGNA